MDRRSTILAIKEQVHKKPFDPLVVIVLAIYFMWHISMGLIQPFINPYFFEISSGDYFLTGLLNGIPYFSMIFSVFIFGSIVDKIGSKRVILFGFIFYLIQVILLIFISEELLFFVIYVLFNSLMACFIPAVQKYASLTMENVFGLMAAIASLGYFFGSVTGGFLFDLGSMNLLFILAMLACIIGVIITILAKDIRKSNSRESLVDKEENPRISDEENKHLRNPGNPTSSLTAQTSPYRGILVVLFLITIISSFQGAFAGQFTTIYLLEELGAASAIVGIMFGGATLLGFFASYGVGVYGKKTGKFKSILILCYASYTVVWASFIVTENIWILSIMYMIPVYVGLFIAAPTIITLKISEEKRGTYLGIFTSFQYAGFSAGVIFGGLIASIQGTIRDNFAVSAAVCILLVILIAVFFKED